MERKLLWTVNARGVEYHVFREDGEEYILIGKVGDIEYFSEHQNPVYIDFPIDILETLKPLTQSDTADRVMWRARVRSNKLSSYSKGVVVTKYD